MRWLTYLDNAGVARSSGGVRLIMFGDLSQLPPVVTADDFIDKYYESRFFFSSKALRASGFSVIIFENVFRQKILSFFPYLRI